MYDDVTEMASSEKIQPYTLFTLADFIGLCMADTKKRRRRRCHQ